MTGREKLEPLIVLGLGAYLPATKHSVAEMASRQGVDSAAYRGWSHVVLAGDGEHPSDMATAAAKAALDDARCAPNDVVLVLFTGVSRDYLPSWSVATEIVKRLGGGANCIGLDVPSGCLGTLLALEMAEGWLQTRPGKVALVVAAERWAETVNYGDLDSMGVWGHSDGAGAMVVSVGPSPAARWTYQGSAFTGDASWNGHVLVPHGGTRSPQAPAGESPHERVLSGRSRSDVLAHYVAGYERVISEIRTTTTQNVSHVVCNQASPRMVERIAAMSGVTSEQVVRSGLEFGHMGSADLPVGLLSLSRGSNPPENVLIAASTSYGFGAALLSRST
jgi:3-oxoacyl-[acyl-carrier-protein] synthase-3